MANIAGEGKGRAGRGGGGRPRLTDEQARDVFHRAHAVGGEPYRVIGKRFGIAGAAVGYIARGATYAELFKIVPASDAPPGPDGLPMWDYVIWDKLQPQVRYRMRIGRRGKR